jgi:hypothetical protein
MDLQSVDTSEPIAEDQRLFERFPTNCLARYRNATDHRQGEFFLRNASAQGISCVTRDPLYVKDVLSLDVDIPDSTDPLHVQAEVVWLKKDEEDLWDIGLKLHNTRLVDMSRLYAQE